MKFSNRMTFIVSQFPAFNSNILDSQLFSKAKLLSELGWECQFIGTDIVERCTAHNFDFLRTQYGFIDIKIFPVYPKTPSYSSFSKMLKTLKPEVSKVLEEWNPAWVYLRNIFDFCAFQKEIKSSGGKCVYDVRSALSNEVRHNTNGIKGRMKELYLLYKERILFRKADHLLCVSQHMKEWIAQVSGRMNAIVVPCCANHEQFYPDKCARLKRRAELGWSIDSPAIAYVGGYSYWQRPKDIVWLLAKLKARIPQLKVLILTGSVKSFSEMFAEVGISCGDVHIRKVPHGEVASWLNVADAGLILRHDILLNNVASPIKIGEYLATGLAIICTKGIGDYSHAISQAQAGLVLDDKLFDEELVALITDTRRLQECRQNALSLSRFYGVSFERERFIEFIEAANFGG